MNTKMYILVKRDIPSHKCLAIAHGVLMCHLRFADRPEYKDWLANSFRKVVCEVTDGEFEEAKMITDRVIVTESGLDGMEIGLVFCPRTEFPPFLKFLPLMKI